MLRTGAVHGAHSARVPAFAACAALAAVQPPARADWFAACPADGDPLGNDQVGCCVPAADYRWIEAVLASTSGSDLWKPTRGMVLGRYSALTGYNAITGTNDNGTPTVMDLADLTTRGITLASVQRKFVPWQASVDPLNDDHLAIAVGLCAPVLVTFNLPRNWAAIESDLNAWNVAPGQGSDWEPIEGHRVLLGRFDGVERWVRTWGMDPAIHPDWWRRYCLGVDLLVDRNLVDASGRSARGLDLSGLMRAMGAAA
jgi:hypothetical protein